MNTNRNSKHEQEWEQHAGIHSNMNREHMRKNDREKHAGMR